MCRKTFSKEVSLRMKYLLIGMAVSFISVFLPCIIGIFIGDKSNRINRTLFGAGASVVYGLLLFWLFYWSQTGTYGPAPLAFPIFIGLIISAVIVGLSYEEQRWGDKGFSFKFKKVIPHLTLFGVYLAYIIVIGIGSGDMVSSAKKAQLIGEVKIVNTLDEVIKPADNKHICRVSKEIAKVYAQTALSQIKLDDGAIAGSRYTLEESEPTKQLVEGNFWWIFPLDFQGYFTWTDKKDSPAYLRVSAEDPSVAAQPVFADKEGNKFSMKYLTSAYFSNRAERYVRQNGYMSAILADWTFEVDENWKPYYTVSVLERTIGFSGLKTKGILLIDVQSGEITPYEMEDIPEWVDRVVPLNEVIDVNVKKWGLFSNSGWWHVFVNKDMSFKPTEGWFMTYNEGRAQWYSGLTSMNDKDNALSGVIVVDARTGQVTKYVNAQGFTENIAINSATALWNNYQNYEGTEMVPYNIYGTLTYLVPMKCNNILVGFSLVSLDIKVSGKGETLEEALIDYKTNMVINGNTELIPDSELPKVLKLEGEISRIGFPITTAASTTFTFQLKDVDKLFQVTFAATAPKPLIMAVGDKVVLTYKETTEVLVNVDTFDIPAVILGSGSIIQAQYEQNQVEQNEEVDRIDNQQKLDDILNSDAAKKLDADALQAWIESQTTTTAATTTPAN